VAGVAHQLNTPLAFTKSNVQMVRKAIDGMQAPMHLARSVTGIIKKAEGDQVVLNIAQARFSLDKLEAGDTDLERLKQMLGDVLEGVAQMSEMVVNLLDFTRLDRAKTTDADLNKSLRTVIYMARSVISTKIEVKEVFGDLPLMECNPSQLNQVFLNLVNNAAQAIDETGTITVRSLHEGDTVKVQVSDTGRGIPADVLAHIFDPYYTTKPQGEGTGLGLPIVRDIVRQHGGDITVETVPGTGTTFTVTLPVKLPEGEIKMTEGKMA
jgi:two-component system NtrC family sensor kinase